MAAIGMLGFVVVLNKPQSSTHRSFFLFSLLTIAYGFVNFMNQHINSSVLVLWYLRLTIFFAVWHAFSLLHFVTVFPDYTQPRSRVYTIVLPVVLVVSVLTLTPFVFSGVVGITSSDEVATAETGPGIVIFAATVLFLISSSIYQLFQKTRHARGIAQSQLRYVSWGIFLTFACILFFNVLLPLVFDIVTFVPLAPLYFLPFIGFTAYAIMRYQLLNVKIIATELFSFILAIILLAEIDFTAGVQTMIFRFSSLALFILFSYYLIRSVHREAESRAEIEKLAGELQKINVELARVNQAKSDFLSIASHQLKTPLSIIKGYLSMVLEGSFGSVGQPVHAQLNKVYISNERLISLVEDLLNFSRLEEGHMQYDREEADLIEIVSSVIDELKDFAKRKRLALEWIPPPDPFPVIVDKLKMRNVVFNLLDNAIKYTDSGSVTVRARKEGEKAIIKIIDTGKGMSKADLERIFQKFQRGEVEKKEKSRRLTATGFGLGLYVAFVMTKDHKGTVTAFSDGPGKGSTFCLTLPLQKS